MAKAHPGIGCCGIDCGLCPRYHTQGASRCPGCGGEGFAALHPSCGFHTCCQIKQGLEVCAQCGQYPCARFDKEDGSRDSFVTHRKVRLNQQAIIETGLEPFLSQQGERRAFLEAALRRHDDGRSKSFYCLAVALLSLDGLKAALAGADEGGNLRELLKGCAAREGQELRLRK